MPITQSRMIDLISAARDYQQALQASIDFTKSQVEAVDAGRISVQDAFNLITANTNPYILMADPIKSATTVILEAKHFHLNRKANTKRAEQMAKLRGRRRVEGYQPAAPAHIQDLPPAPHGMLGAGKNPLTDYQPDFEDGGLDIQTGANPAEHTLSPDFKPSPELEAEVQRLLRVEEDKERNAKLNEL